MLDYWLGQLQILLLITQKYKIQEMKLYNIRLGKALKVGQIMILLLTQKCYIWLQYLQTTNTTTYNSKVLIIWS